MKEAKKMTDDKDLAALSAEEKEAKEQGRGIKIPFFSGRLWPGKWRKKDKTLFLKLGAVLVVGLVFMNVVAADSAGKKVAATDNQAVVIDSDYRNSEAALERRLAEVLSQIKGAGVVQVAVTFSTGAESQYAVDTELTDSTVIEAAAGSSDSSRQSVESQQRTTLASQDGQAVLVKQSMPRIEGVLVVSPGAGDGRVKQQLFSSVQSLLGISAHRINIVEGI